MTSFLEKFARFGERAGKRNPLVIFDNLNSTLSLEYFIELCEELPLRKTLSEITDDRNLFDQLSRAMGVSADYNSLAIDPEEVKRYLRNLRKSLHQKNYNQSK